MQTFSTRFSFAHIKRQTKHKSFWLGFWLAAFHSKLFFCADSSVFWTCSLLFVSIRADSIEYEIKSAWRNYEGASQDKSQRHGKVSHWKLFWMLCFICRFFPGRSSHYITIVYYWQSLHAVLFEYSLIVLRSLWTLQCLRLRRFIRSVHAKSNAKR